MEASVAERIKEIAEQAAIDNGLELVHVEVAGPEGHPVVRVFIDKPGGVTHDDCSEVSTQMGTMLDVEDFIHSTYTLEVSSPGIDRPLTVETDFARFAGHEARVELIHGLDGRRRFKGLIIGLDGRDIVMDVSSERSGPQRVRLPFSDIAEAKLVLTDRLIQESLKAREARDAKVSH